MSKFLSTTFGKISGKHGTAVGSTYNGESVLKVYTRPSNPKTIGQQSQRLKFGMVAHALNSLRNIITVGFGSKNGYYQAVSLAIRNATEGSYPAFSVNYAKVVLSSGSLPQSPAVSISASGNMNVAVAWDTTVWSTADASDPVYVAFLNPLTQMVIFTEAQAKRGDGAVTILLPAPWLGATLHAWLFFTSANRKLSSVSQYLGTVVPA
jgi:hypothetical protein